MVITWITVNFIHKNYNIVFHNILFKRLVKRREQTDSRVKYTKARETENILLLDE